MDSLSTVIQDGAVYLADKVIVATQPFAAPAPPGFEQTTRVETGGTIFPGLIELHDHLSYNALPLWDVPKKYTNRNQWSGPSTPDYHKLVTGPMSVLGKMPEYVNAIVRFVECRCLLGGVTTSQGIALSSNAGIMRHYRVLVSIVEMPGDLNVVAAPIPIPDVDVRDAEKFLPWLPNTPCLLVHLSDVPDTRAHSVFELALLRNGSV